VLGQLPDLVHVSMGDVFRKIPKYGQFGQEIERFTSKGALVPDDLLKAAAMDGASWWQRFTKVMLPVMKPAILVALLFRTLDAFRVFDNIYVLTNGANETSSVSMIAYNNLIKGLNLGIGSTMSVLIFIAVAIIAFVFVKLFGTAAPGSSDDGRR